MEELNLAVTNLMNFRVGNPFKQASFLFIANKLLT